MIFASYDLGNKWSFCFFRSSHFHDGDTFHSDGGILVGWVGLWEASCSGHGYSTPPQEVGGNRGDKAFKKGKSFCVLIVPPYLKSLYAPLLLARVLYHPLYSTVLDTRTKSVLFLLSFFNRFSVSVLFRFSLSAFKSCLGHHNGILG